jgi:nucleoside-diphosphate-sugar epimerase
MHVLVTGSQGYIGSILAPLLAGAGHDVVGLDAGFYRGCDFGREDGSVRTIERDVRDVVASELEGFDAIVHLAALSNDPVGDLDPGLTAEINFAATVRLAELAREAGVRRFVFASSCSMYGASGSDDALTEDAPLRPITAYAESKVRSEEGLVRLAGPDFAPVSMRNATVYGVSARLRLDIVLNNLAAWSHTTGRIRLTSDGTAWRPLVHVQDVARAALVLLEAPEAAICGEAFNVGSDAQNYLIRDLAELLSDLTGCEVEFAEGSSADARSYRVNFGRLRRAFPEVAFEWDARRGAEELVEAYRRYDLTAAEFEGERFIRLRRLRTLLDSGELNDRLRWRDSVLI